MLTAAQDVGRLVSRKMSMTQVSGLTEGQLSVKLVLLVLPHYSWKRRETKTEGEWFGV